MIIEQILGLIEAGEFDDIEPSEVLFKRIEQHKRMTSQLIKDHGLKLTERDHFRNYASYTLKQGTLSEQDGFIRGLNIPLFVKDRTIYRRISD
jgi:hypothetical protein